MAQLLMTQLFDQCWSRQGKLCLFRRKNESIPSGCNINQNLQFIFMQKSEKDTLSKLMASPNLPFITSGNPHGEG